MPDTEITQPEPVAVDAVEALALLFHNTYERLAPGYGYSTRHDTRIFDAKSANGRLVLAVCEEVLARGYTLRHETMTEAELEMAIDDVFNECETVNEMKMAIMNLAKKFRG